VKGLGCKEAIKELGKPIDFSAYRFEYNRFQRVDLIINRKITYKVNFIIE
jgi:hypothetical protein